VVVRNPTKRKNYPLRRCPLNKISEKLKKMSLSIIAQIAIQKHRHQGNITPLKYHTSLKYMQRHINDENTKEFKNLVLAMITDLKEDA
jgi:hypothetical protein